MCIEMGGFVEDVRDQLGGGGLSGELIAGRKEKDEGG